MKSKIPAFILICLLAVSAFSCKKMWQCTCTARTPTGIQVDTFAITVKVDKITAEGDCYLDCHAVIFNAKDTDVTSSVKSI